MALPFLGKDQGEVSQGTIQQIINSKVHMNPDEPKVRP